MIDLKILTTEFVNWVNDYLYMEDKELFWRLR